MDGDNVYSQNKIQIYTYDRQLYFVRGQRAAKAYPIAVGKPETPTPTGTYHIANKAVNPGGVLGTRWMGLDIPDGPYGIHGTFQTDSIGRAISNGCIRMYNQDVEELFNQVRVGTTVVIDQSSPGMGTDFSIYTVIPGVGDSG
ncbi:MAG: L,D-transpeptidase [Eubacteriales bacterium]